MKIANLKQEPFNASLMGCIKGASDHYGFDYSGPMLYGLSGHAFLVNIHPELCPSAPYVWNHDSFYGLLANLGIRKAGEYYLGKGASGNEIATIDARVRAHLDGGNLCLLDYLEHQLVSGYGETGYVFIRPWSGTSCSTLPRLSFGTWEECLTKEGWVHFTLLEKSAVTFDFRDSLNDAVSFALELAQRPESIQSPGYVAGPGAWAVWCKAIEAGAGSSHGHWWNGMVWGECRSMAADFFAEAGRRLGRTRNADACAELASLYGRSAELIGKAKEKNLPAAEQLAAIRKVAGLESECRATLERLLQGV